MMTPLPRCPVETTLLLIDNRWKPLIWCALYYGKKRFGEIRKVVGKVSTKVLTTNLRSMEENGLISRKVFAEVPPRVEYTLTELGLSLKPILYAMVDWGSNYKFNIEGQMPIRTKDGILMIITKATEDDLQTILELQYLAYQSEAKLFNSSDIPPLKQTLQEVKSEYEKGIILKVLDEDNNIIGSARAYCENDIVYIGKLIVHPDWQRKGIGTKLLLEIEHLYPTKRYELFTSTRSTGNIKLYERLGYKAFKEKSINSELKFVYLAKE